MPAPDDEKISWGEKKIAFAALKYNFDSIKTFASSFICNLQLCMAWTKSYVVLSLSHLILIFFMLSGILNPCGVTLPSTILIEIYSYEERFSPGWSISIV